MTDLPAVSTSHAGRCGTGDETTATSHVLADVSDVAVNFEHRRGVQPPASAPMTWTSSLPRSSGGVRVVLIRGTSQGAHPGSTTHRP